VALLTSGGIDPTQTIKLAGEKAVEGVWFWSVDPPATPEIKAFDERYEKEFGVPSMSNAKSAYDVAQVVAKALERAGTVSDSKAIRDALAKTDYHGYMGHYYFDERGESFLKMNFGLFEKGSFKITKGE
jgi:ABC-type branched-subunit amino acid transport system substrate-binding protein